MTLILTLWREKLVTEPLGERKFMMLLRLLNGSVRRNILEGGEKRHPSHFDNFMPSWAANNNDDARGNNFCTLNVP